MIQRGRLNILDFKGKIRENFRRYIPATGNITLYEFIGSG